MQSLRFLLAFLAAGASAFPSHEYSCIDSNKICTLQNVTLESESELDRVNFPTITDPLIIASGKIPNFTRKLAEKLDGITDLIINRLELETLYVKPEMLHLEATCNRIETLLVDDDLAKVYEIRSLNLTGNKLTDVGILSRFVKLRQLTLAENSLERLSMDVFTGMSELRTLSLANNQLYTVDTEKSLQLLKLRSLSFAGNQLMELNVEKWELESLKELDLSNNKLYLLDGSLEQFKALVDVKISENYWKCEFLVGLNRLDRFKFDQDESGRCEAPDFSDVKQVCCTHDVVSILENTAGGDLGLLNDKCEELRQLNESFQQFKNATEQNQQRIGELEEDNENTLVERMKQLEEEQKKIWNKLNDQESVAVEETAELKRDISNLKSTIEELESKHLDLESKLEGFENTLRETMNEKFEAVDEIKEKVAELEDKTNGDEVKAVEKRLTELKDTFKHLEGQQLKYHLASVDLKRQIGTERSRVTKVHEQYSKLQEETDQLRNHMSTTLEDINTIMKILREM